MAWLVYKKIMRCTVYLFALLSVAASGAQFQRLLVIGNGADNISAVRSTVQDRLGFIWFGGENGLARYDGNDTVLYQANPEDPKSLSGNYIWSMTIDHDGVIWIGTWRGLNRYNAKTDDFDRFVFDAAAENSISNNDILSLAVDQNNNLIIGTAYGLNILNPQRTHFQHFFYAPAESASVGQDLIQDVFVDSKNQIWIGTNNHGLNLFSRETGTFTAFLHDPEDPASLIDNDVFAIEEDSKGQLWVGTQNRGLSRMNVDGKTFTHYQHDPLNPSSLANDQVADILEDANKNLWVALDRGGLALYHHESDSFRVFKHSAYDINSISSNHPRDLYEDNQGDLWLGMFPTGVNFMDQSTAVFTNYSHKPDDLNSLIDNGILCFFEDSEGILWIGTEYGLNAFDQQKHTFTRYAAKPEEQRGLQFGAVLSIVEDVTGELWIGTWSGGLYRFNKKTNKFYNYFPDETDPNSINSEYIWKVLRDKEDTIWLATGTGGLNRYNRKTDSFSHYTADARNPNSITSNRVWTAMLDSKGDLWLGTLGGLNHFNSKTQEFTHYLYDPLNKNSLSSNHVVSLFEDSRGRIWAGTRDAGLNIFDVKDKSFRWLGVSDGLPSNSISSIIEDSSGAIWVTAVNGIARINPDTFVVTVYSQAHGLISKNYNRDATFKDRAGQLYVGGTDGFSIFDPARIFRKSAPPSPVITDFRVFNRSVPIDEKGGLLTKSITATDKLILSYKHSMFSFDFAALSYRSPWDNQYAYMLEGFDQSWNEIGNKRTATYTNIDPGKYVFRVKAANRDGVWSSEDASIVVVITPPWWRSGWAYAGYLLAFMGIIYAANSYKTLHVKSAIYRTLSATDPLTGIGNRAAILQAADQLFVQNKIQEGIGLFVIDLDHFKRINDTFGHDAGDRILREFAELVGHSVRVGDNFARWGGEEFVLLCLAINRDGAVALAEKIRKMVEVYPFEKDHSPVELTVSIGIAFARPHDDFEKIFKRADVALYKAKTSGRNQIVVGDNGEY